MGVNAAGDVVFDYVGALTLARRLWVLADQLDEYAAERETASTTALTGWTGPYATEFVARRDSERSSTSAVAAGLRGDAVKWAQAWVSAMNEQNHVLWARHHEQLKDNRSTLESIGDFFGGFHDDTPHPAPVSTPAAPYFSATASLVRF